MDNIRQSLEKLYFYPEIVKSNEGEHLRDLSKSEEIEGFPMEKTLFIECIKTLQEIEETSADLFELGVDISPHEENFYTVIHSLFSALFSMNQVNFIHYFLFSFPIIEGQSIFTDQTGKELNPQTPEELWAALSILK